MKIKKWISFLVIVVGGLLLPTIVKAEKLKAPDVFDAGKWTYIGETGKFKEEGAIQSVCVTRDYILCLENASNNTKEPDTLVAFYKNDYDHNGNPVEQYSYAFNISERDYEHCNGMTYNERDNKVVIAAGPTKVKKNRGKVFILDADTLKYERAVSVINNGDSVAGIAYMEDKNQYVLMIGKSGSYDFVLADSEFRILDTIVEGNKSGGNNSFQDFCVSGDYIIGLPYFKIGQVEQLIQLYSISKGEWLANYPLIFTDDMRSMEPEGICEVSPGHFMVGTMLNNPRRMGLYALQVPVVYSVKTSIENGTISKGKKSVDYGAKFKVEYTPDEGYEVAEILVNNEPVEVKKYLKKYTFDNIDSDQTIRVICTKIPQYYIKGRVINGSIDEEIQVYENRKVEVNFKPAEHCRLKSIFVDGQLVDSALDVTSYEFDKVNENHEIYVEFEKIPTYVVTTSVLNGYTSEVTATVYEGDSYTASFKPKKNYILQQILVDGKEASYEEGTSNYEIKSIYGAHKIEVIYRWRYLYWVVAISGLAIIAGMILLGLFYSRKIKERRAAMSRH